MILFPFGEQGGDPYRSAHVALTLANLHSLGFTPPHGGVPIRLGQVPLPLHQIDPLPAPGTVI